MQNDVFLLATADTYTTLGSCPRTAHLVASQKAVKVPHNRPRPADDINTKKRRA